MSVPAQGGEAGANAGDGGGGLGVVTAVTAFAAVGGEQPLGLAGAEETYGHACFAERLPDRHVTHLTGQRLESDTYVTS
ncbi:hypothetical protein [Streptosporangium sp. NBC_01756]|uniref:hypothetical protein n=1 Tax=Streptosporangium sp. NBC_01756 TaxID=2975950 RepID=UPI00308F3CC8|nr:hypothetical protein OIE48_04735 [Streptosporangium sp. NBC_01756]